MKAFNLENRKIVLAYSLMIEMMVSEFLSRLLGIQKASDTLCFSNKSTALSFNQKVNLLIDIAALDKGDKAKFLTFMEIRNQFMHNGQADTFESCCSFMEGKETYLLKNYPQDKNHTREQQLKDAFDALANEVSTLSMKLWNKVQDKIKGEVEQKTNRRTLDAMLAGSKRWQDEVDKYVEDVLSKITGDVSILAVRRLVRDVRRLLFKRMKEELTKMDNQEEKKSVSA